MNSYADDPRPSFERAVLRRLTIMSIVLVLWAAAVVGSALYVGVRLEAQQSAHARNTRALLELEDTLDRKLADSDSRRSSSGEYD